MNKLIDTGAVAAAYCVADESIDAFRRFHAALYAQRGDRDGVSRQWAAEFHTSSTTGIGFRDRSVGPAVKVPTTVDVAC